MPLKEMEVGELPASLVTVTEPVALPVTVGANFMLSVAVCEGFRVAGVVTPLTEYPVPLTATVEILTAAFPVLVRTTDCVVLLPVATDPKLILVELALNWPVAAADPVPVNGTLSDGFVGSLLVMVTLPVTAPAVVGENVTIACADCPALMVAGVAMPLMPNSEPVNVIIETVKSPDPELPITRFALPFCPFETVPKLIDVGAIVSWG